MLYRAHEFHLVGQVGGSFGSGKEKARSIKKLRSKGVSMIITEHAGKGSLCKKAR